MIKPLPNSTITNSVLKDNPEPELDVRVQLDSLKSPLPEENSLVAIKEHSPAAKPILQERLLRIANLNYDKMNLFKPNEASNEKGCFIILILFYRKDQQMQTER